jgi:hypothetical protein
MVTNSMKNSMKNTLLSFFNNMAYVQIESKYKDSSPLEQMIMNIEKYYSKYKCLKISTSDAAFLTKKLKKIQTTFEEFITIKGDDTIEYSPQLLSLLLLDYMLLEEMDLSLRVKFGHLHIGGMLSEVEIANKTIAYSSYDIIGKMLKEVDVL